MFDGCNVQQLEVLADDKLTEKTENLTSMSDWNREELLIFVYFYFSATFNPCS